MQTDLRDPPVPPTAATLSEKIGPAGPFLTAAWRWLVMLNYHVPADALQPWVPRGTELDEHAGQAILSVVGFRFEAARLFGIRVPFHQGFPEVNLRFYVRRTADGRARRGVVFLREIVPRRLVVWTARLFYGERFVRAPVRARMDCASGARVPGPHLAEYAWGDGPAATRLAAVVDGARLPVAPTGEAEFVVNRSWAYTVAGDAVREYEVTRRPWRIWPARHALLAGNPRAWYAPRLAAALRGDPSSAFLVDGSEVAVFPGRTI